MVVGRQSIFLFLGFCLIFAGKELYMGFWSFICDMFLFDWLFGKKKSNGNDVSDPDDLNELDKFRDDLDDLDRLDKMNSFEDCDDYSDYFVEHDDCVAHDDFFDFDDD